MPTKVASCIESTSLMSSTKLNRNHDLDETDRIGLLNTLNPNADFSAAFHNRQDLVTMQHNDPSLDNLFSSVKPKSDDANGHYSFFLENDVLIRAWKDRHSSNFDDSEVTQIVAPKPIRS